MKKLNNLFVILMVLSLVGLSSCSSDDTDGSGNAPSGTMTASVDGVSFASLEISSSATVANTGGSSNLIIIATNSDGNGFAFTLIGYDGPGTYPLGGGANIANSGSYTEIMVDLMNPVNSSTEIWQAPFDSNQVGSITITEETSTMVMGNFEFMCKNVNGDQSTKIVTNGLFNLNKQ